MVSTSFRISLTLQFNASNHEPFLECHHRRNLTNYFHPRLPPLRPSILTFSSRRRDKAAPSVAPKKHNKKKLTSKTAEVDADVDEDAFEALFRQLEEDLKNDGPIEDEDHEISEEELAKLESELAETLEDDELLAAFEAIAGVETEPEDEEEGNAINYDGDEVDVDNEEEERPLELKNWQLKKLAYALKNGRRKTSIKNLAADLCLDRAVVLKLLRDPPPNLVLMSAALPDEPVSPVLEPVEKPTETVPLETMPTPARPEVERLPVHVMQSNWSARKRLKKVQIETLERVYRRTKRPTNAMISSIVHVTNLPRKRIVKWFEDKRAEDGVPEHRHPYQRAASENVFTN